MTGDEVLCSFCGRNVWWGSEDGPCEHLLADWALDPNDNGGGVLGEMLSRDEGIAGAEALGRVSGKLSAWVWSAGNEPVEARLRLAANAVVGKNPALWAALHEAILDCYDPETIIECYGAEPASISTRSRLPPILLIPWRRQWSRTSPVSASPTKSSVV